MASEPSTGPAGEPPAHQPFVPPGETQRELTVPAVVAGALLGIVFGASSLYLVLKVGLTVSASVPIAVLSITLFRAISKAFKVRTTTILENNVVQTAGSAGESIAFGVGVTMPALLLLGFEMDPVRVMTVSVLGAILGILMMIPLRRAFIVKQHGKLIYPEGTACAEVLVAGEKGGATAQMVFVGFGIALVHKFCAAAAYLWSSTPSIKLYSTTAAGTKTGLKGAALGGELAPELIGVGYLIGPRVACLMMAGAVLSYFMLAPAIATFGETASEPVAPAKWDETKPKDANNPGLIRNMGPGELKGNYVRYIGAGAVAAGGIISMCRALPLILSSVVGGLRDLRGSGGAGNGALRTERDVPMTVVIFGSLALVLVLAAVPQLGLGFTPFGVLGAGLILLFGFLFVTVSSRLTGEVGSSSNPISGMTIATLLLVCLIFFVLGRTGPEAMLTALTVAAVVCIASSNGGTTSQDLKTGYLVGATPAKQQWAILIGSVVSALVIGLTMLQLNAVGTHYTKQGFDATAVLDVPADAPSEKPGKPYDRHQPPFADASGKQNPGWAPDERAYRVVHVRAGEHAKLAAGRYLVNETGNPAYRADVPIDRQNKKDDAGDPAPKDFSEAPQPGLFSNIIKGILGGTLEWALIVTGVMIAVALELCGVAALPVAVGMYISLASTTPIFVGGMLRFVADKLRGKPKSEAESETSPGVLLASGYIAGGTLCGLIVAFLAFDPDVKEFFNFGSQLFGTVDETTGKTEWDAEEHPGAKWAALATFGLLGAFLLWVGARKEKPPAA